MSEPPERSGPGWGHALVLMGLVVFTAGGALRVGRQLTLARDLPGFARAEGEVVLSELVERGGRDYVSARVVVRYWPQGAPDPDAAPDPGAARELDTSGRDGRADPAPDASTFVARHPLGARVPVYYDPEDPARASLTRQVRFGSDLGVAIGLLVLTLGFSAWLAVQRRRTRRAA